MRTWSNPARNPLMSTPKIPKPRVSTCLQAKPLKPLAVGERIVTQDAVAAVRRAARAHHHQVLQDDPARVFDLDASPSAGGQGRPAVTERPHHHRRGRRPGVFRVQDQVAGESHPRFEPDAVAGLEPDLVDARNRPPGRAGLRSRSRIVTGRTNIVIRSGG